MKSYIALLAATGKRRRFFGAALAGLAIGAGSIGFAGLAPIASALAQEKERRQYGTPGNRQADPGGASN